MKKYLALLLIVLAASVFAQTAQELIGNQQASTTSFAQNWLANYQAIIWVAAMIMVVFVAIIYFAGFFLQNDQIKQMAKIELVQAGATVLIVVAFLGFVNFADAMLNYTAAQIHSPCLDAQFVGTLSPDITRLNMYAACYADNLHGMAADVAKGALGESVQDASEAYRSVGGQSSTVWFGYLGYIYRPDAHLRLDSEIKRIEFTILSDFITSLTAQAVILGNIIPVLGPSAILLGLILRSFFFSRKLGGLLLAAGFSLMLVLPAMYLLAWFTLQVQAYGPQAISQQSDTCPDSCKIQAPWGYDMAKNTNGATLAMGIKGPAEVASVYGVYSTEDYNSLVEARVKDAKDYISANDAQGWFGQGVQLCYPDTDTGAIKASDSQNCPSQCRYFPAPAGLNCDYAACDAIFFACKAIKPMTENEVGKYCSSDPDSEFACSCPAFCQVQLPQVKATGSTGYVGPTANANDMTGENSGSFDCTQCPSQCRAYISDATPYITTHDGQGNVCDIQCKQCMDDRQDSGKPDLMYGIPSIRNSVCNEPDACGLGVSIKEAQDKGIANVCPLECRINFDASQQSYKDPTFIAECEGTYKDACGSCSSFCKVDAADIISSTGTSPDACATPPQYFKNGDSSQGACSASDANDGNCKMDKQVDYNCARCPEPCRFTNPDSINYNHGVDLFRSSSHEPVQCVYSKSPIAYSGSCTDADFTGYSGISWLGNPTPNVAPEPPACSPYQTVYRLALGQPGTCPHFIFPPTDGLSPPDPNTLEQKLQEIGLGKPYLISEDANTYTVSVRANPNVASLCASEDAQAFCADDANGQAYCPDSCKVDRAQVGPQVCEIDITNPYSGIEGNSNFCGGCYVENAQKTTGPQCQVYLDWEQTQGQQEGILPAGCSNSCNPSTADPSARGAGCDGFCYPRLTVPYTAGVCEDYDSSSAANANREVSSCLACPVECRYDYTVDANGDGSAQVEISEDAAKMCGLEYNGVNYGIENAHNCNLMCRGRIAPPGIGSQYAYCTQNENYDCSQTAAAAQGIWVRGIMYDQTNIPSPSKCYLNVVAHGTLGAGNQNTYVDGQDKSTAPNCPDPDGDEKCDGNWYDGCPAVYTYFAATSYRICTPQHKYAGIDSYINQKFGLGNLPPSGQYFECGNINPDNANFNLCGNVGSANTVASACANTCDATYNARAVECLAGDMYNGGLGLPSQGADANCNFCPYFCRESDADGNSLCTLPSVAGQLGNIACESPSQCDLRTAQDSQAPNPIGYCSIPLSDFHIDLNNPLPNPGSSTCALSQPDSTACPLRCRIDLGGSGLSPGCEGGDVGQACKTIGDACRIELPDSPCLSCGFCQIESCTQQPKVWTDCSLCTAQDLSAGATDVTPADLVSSLSGAKATNTAWRNIGAMGVPAIVLPMLAIITTLAFIHALSPILGGDVEIPGLLKLI
ncbi:MAG: hypothetical protein V1822_03710 [Candidatus Micrarchaeota archaeon]